ncbi:Vinorine synthase [Morella rubra]|uniref:Vinorine synthase n=1 Tax=Morella rubra TaxID=262757 RepID=A0A6A1UTI7_9ROSI|nr:Vinorine synthase [Morella rubra]
MEVEIISREFIKPTSPTPPAMKTYEVSLLDRLIPPLYVPVILFYPMDQSTGLAARKRTITQAIPIRNLNSLLPSCGKNHRQSLYRFLRESCHGTGEQLCSGGIAIGVLFAYRDGTALSVFLRLGSHMPTRRIVFDASAIASLKAKASSSSVPKPSRVEVVSAFLWKCISAAYQAKSGINRPTLITHAVNLRPRSIPPFKQSSMGNLIWSAGALCTSEEGALPYRVTKIREAVAKINAELVKNLKDFGWGKPFWASCSAANSSDSEQRSTSNKPCKSTIRRIVFDASPIASLKAKASSLSVENPTRVEVVSALLWKCISAALQVKSGIKRPTVITHAVNFRPRSNPP